tara:strand:+ start:186 stop:422 length:237 start_codon:yes stop_codon:yes gene_type:complete
MANVTIVVTAEQSACLPLREDEAGKKETVKAFCQRHIDSVAKVAIGQQRQRDFDALPDERKDAVIASEKALAAVEEEK